MLRARCSTSKPRSPKDGAFPNLREELEEAKERRDIERAEQAEQEIDALTRELARAVGLGGRNRQAASASERARQSITKSIKAVLERIKQNETVLGDILARCIKTGTFCSYQPDPDFPIAWEFAAATVQPDQPPAARADRASARADHPQGPPVVLEVSPFSLAERTAFVGRESERSAIGAIIDRPRAGHGAVVMLDDGPGVGKTRLAMEMAEYASRTGFRCSVGHCYEREEPYPYIPFAEIIESNLAQSASLEDYREQMDPCTAELAQIAPSLRRIFPDLPKPLELPAAQQRGYLFQSLADAMAQSARIRPCTYLLEDLHWADESTLALLTYLATRVAQLPANNNCTRASPTRSSSSILVPRTSAPETSRTISSRQGPSPTSGNWSAGLRWLERAHFRRRHLRQRSAVSGPPCHIKVPLK